MRRVFCGYRIHGRTLNPVGASLLAMRPCQSTSSLPDTLLSRASSLPQGSRLSDPFAVSCTL
ncbi:hypothetical protein C1X64_08155 [Pseudomonas sp. GW456-E7]|nr:hypothetical protein C1X64_08155 [Pseudomonas sp. GW456-E7]